VSLTFSFFRIRICTDIFPHDIWLNYFTIHSVCKTALFPLLCMNKNCCLMEWKEKSWEKFLKIIFVPQRELNGTEAIRNSVIYAVRHIWNKSSIWIAHKGNEICIHTFVIKTRLEEAYWQPKLTAVMNLWAPCNKDFSSNCQSLTGALRNVLDDFPYLYAKLRSWQIFRSVAVNCYVFHTKFKRGSLWIPIHGTRYSWTSSLEIHPYLPAGISP
jgi:hypothetical protein